MIRARKEIEHLDKCHELPVNFDSDSHTQVYVNIYLLSFVL